MDAAGFLPREPCVFESVSERIPAQAPWGDTVHGVSLGESSGCAGGREGGRKAVGRLGASGTLGRESRASGAFLGLGFLTQTGGWLGGF